MFKVRTIVLFMSFFGFVNFSFGDTILYSTNSLVPVKKQNKAEIAATCSLRISRGSCVNRIYFKLLRCAELEARRGCLEEGYEKYKTEEIIDGGELGPICEVSVVGTCFNEN